MPVTINKNILGVDYPVTFEAEDILKFWMTDKISLIEFIETTLDGLDYQDVKKGVLIKFMAKMISSLRKDENDIVKIKLNELKKMLDNN